MQRFLKNHLNFELSLGSIFNKQGFVNKVLLDPVSKLLTAARSGHAYMDETSHFESGKRHWLWTLASKEVAYYEIYPSRGKKVLKQLMEGFENILVTDRYAAYNYFDSSQRQMCWSHLKRDFKRFSERRDPMVSRLGKGLLKQESELFT